MKLREDGTAERLCDGTKHVLEDAIFCVECERAQEAEVASLRTQLAQAREALAEAVRLAQTHGRLWGLRCYCGSVLPGEQIADSIRALASHPSSPEALKESSDA